MLSIVRSELVEALAASYVPPEPKRTAQPSANGHGHRNGAGKPHDVVEQARRYIMAIPGGIQGENGSLPTIKVAGHLVRGFDLSAEQALPLLREWSDAKCQPPWSETELRHKIDSALQHGGERGYILNRRNATANYSSNGATTKENKSDEREPVRFNRITSRELATAVYRIEYLIDRFLVAGQPCVFGGPKKALKTTLLVAMAVALARGCDFLGRFKIAQARRVRIMSGESGIATLQETAKRICAWHECELANLDNLIWSTDLPHIARIDHLDALAEMLREDEVEVVVIDPTYLCLTSESNDAANLFAMGALLGNLSRVCQEQGATLVLAHHTRKGNIADPFEPPELEHIAFAGFQEFCRQWILVGRREKYAHGTGSHRLWLSTGGSAGHSGLWGCDIEEGSNTAAEGRTFDCTIMSAESVITDAKQRAEETKEATQRDRDAGQRNKLLRIMFKHPEGGTRNAVREWSGLNSTNANRIINQLLDSGQLAPCEVVLPNRRKPYEGVTLSAAEHNRLAKLAVHEQADHAEIGFDPNERGQD